MNKVVSYYSSQGGRENNEDYVLTRNMDDSYIAIVCDGLGGHENGEIAAKLAAECIAEECSRSHMSPSVLENAIKKANDAVYQNGTGRTTASVVWIAGEDAIAANVGDTRIYQFRGNRTEYQNKDHSVAYMSYLSGDITYDEIRFSKDRNRLLRALGADSEVRVDVSAIHLQQKDAILICSDGFWEYVDEAQMIQTLEDTADARQWLMKMKEIVVSGSRNSGDNNSAIAIIQC